jgi:hypothetical protein
LNKICNSSAKIKEGREKKEEIKVVDAKPNFHMPQA